MTWTRAALAVILITLVPWVSPAQEKSVKPGINLPFVSPDVGEFQKMFEVESREAYARGSQIAAACKPKSGMVIAAVGAGTGLFPRLFAAEVGADGQVYAVDIAP